MSSTLERPHVFVPGEADSTSRVLVLLHGTGGDEHDLLPLLEHLAPGVPALSVRGSVSEQGKPRFFRRFAEGVFDEDDLRARVDELADFLAAAEQRYDIEPGSEMAVGFSNGANIASALLFQRPSALAGTVLLAGTVPFHAGPPAADLTSKRVAIGNGRRDPMATPTHTETLAGQFRERGATVALFGHDGGHTIETRLLPEIGVFLREDAR